MLVVFEDAGCLTGWPQFLDREALTFNEVHQVKIVVVSRLDSDVKTLWFGDVSVVLIALFHPYSKIPSYLLKR